MKTKRLQIASCRLQVALPRDGRKTHRYAGFSLMELEVVVVILAVLAMLVLPGLAGMKRAGQQVQCLNNLREMGVADLVYVADHGVFIQPSASQYLGNNSEWIGLMVDGLSRNTNVILCPTASQPASAKFLSTALGEGLQANAGFGNIIGTADYYYIRGSLSGGTSGLSSIHCSYMANGWLYFTGTRGSGDGAGFEGMGSIPHDPSLYYTNESCMAMPGNTPLFFDGDWCDTWPMENDASAYNLYTGALGEEAAHNGLEMARMTMTRHSINPEMAEQDHQKSWSISPPVGSINMVFGDGHAQLVKMNYGIWQLNWHRAWGQYVSISPGNPQ